MTKQRLHSITLAGLQRKTAAWRSWQALAEEWAAMLTLVQHALEAWTRSKLDAGWCTWLAAAEETKERLRALVEKWLKRSLAVGWRTWRSMLDERHAARRQVGHALVQWKDSRLSSGVRMWRAGAAARKQRLHSMVLPIGRLRNLSSQGLKFSMRAGAK